MILAQTSSNGAAPALSTTTVQPTSGSVGHYKTKSLGWSAVTSIALVVVGVLLHRRIDAWLRSSSTFRIIVLICSPVMALILSAVASWENIFKAETYETTAASQPDWHTILWAGIWAGGATITILAAFFTFRFKEGEETRSTELEREVAKERVARGAVERQRELLTDITTFAMKIVKKKKDRVAALLTKNVAISDLVEALSPQKQIILLVQMIHEFCMPDQATADFVLRLGLFVRDPADRTRLKMIYSWDGDKSDCFSGRSEPFLKLDSPTGPYPTVVRCFQSTEGFILIPDCEKAFREKRYSYLYVGQEEKSKSVVTYKHLYRNSKNEDDAMVLMLVASKADHFREDDKEEVRQFLREMLTRLELEWMISELLAKITP